MEDGFNMMNGEPERLNRKLIANPAPSPIDGPERADGCHSEACVICGRQQVEGLHIIEEFICKDCESELVRTDVMDAKYPFFIHRMKLIWQRKNA